MRNVSLARVLTCALIASTTLNFACDGPAPSVDGGDDGGAASDSSAPPTPGQATTITNANKGARTGGQRVA